MAAYLLQLKDGKEEVVEAPPNATKAELAQALKELRAKEQGIKDEVSRRIEERDPSRISNLKLETEARRYPARETGIFEDLTSGFGAGAVGMGESAALGLASILEEESELEARKKIQAVAEDFRPSGGDKSSITYGLGQALGSVAGLAAPVAALSAFGAPTAATVTGLGLAGAAGAGEASERARAGGATQEERESYATPLGMLIGFTEMVPIARFVRLVDAPKVNTLVNKFGVENVNTLGSRVRNAAKTAGAEGAQEVVAEFLQNAVESGYNIDQELTEGLIPAGGYGAGAGAIIQTIVDLFTKGRRIGDPKDTGTDQEVVTPLDGAAPAQTTEVVRGDTTQTIEQVIENNDEEAARKAGEDLFFGQTYGETQTPRKADVKGEVKTAREANVKGEDLDEVTGTTFSGTLPLKHGSSESDLTGFIDSKDVKKEVRYKEAGAFGDSSLYMDYEGGPFVSEEQTTQMVDYPPPAYVYDVDAKFEKAFVLTPDTVGELRKIVGGDSKATAAYAGTRGEDVVEKLKEEGYDGLIVKDMEQLEAGLPTIEEREGMSEAERFQVQIAEATRRQGFHGEIFTANQVVSFDPTKNKIVGKPNQQPTDQEAADRMAAVDDDRTPVFSRAGIPPDTAPATPTRDLTSEDFNNEESRQSFLVLKNTLDKDPELRKEFEADPEAFIEERIDFNKDGVASFRTPRTPDEKLTEAFEETTPAPAPILAAETDPEVVDAAMDAEATAEIERVKETITPQEAEAYAAAYEVPVPQAIDTLAKNKMREGLRQERKPATPTTTPQKDIADDAFFESAGIPEDAVTLRKQLAGKDLTVPENRRTLVQYANRQAASNPEVASSVRSYLDQAPPVRKGAVEAVAKPKVKKPPVKLVLSKIDSTALEAYNERAEKNKKPKLDERQYVDKRLNTTPREYMERQAAQAVDEQTIRDEEGFAAWFVRSVPRAYQEMTDAIAKGYSALITGTVKEVKGKFGITLKKDPFTGTDNTAILDLVQGTATRRTDNRATKAKLYFSKHKRPIDGLYLAIQDVVNEAPTFQAENFNPDNPKAKTIKNEMIEEGTYDALDAKTKEFIDSMDRFGAGTNQTNAQATIDWAKANLSEDVTAWIKQVKEYLKGQSVEPEIDETIPEITIGTTKTDTTASKVKDTTDEYRAEQAAKLAEENIKKTAAAILSIRTGVKTTGGMGPLLSVSEAIALDRPLSPEIEYALRQGQLELAVQLMRMPKYESNAKAREAAAALQRVVSTTKVEIQPLKKFQNTVSDLFKNTRTPIAPEDVRARGVYDPKTDKIYLSSDTSEAGLNGVNAATLLHELTHAGTLFSLKKDKGSANYNRLNELYTYAKDKLGDMAGTEKLEEFVAEAFSNPIFQEKLASLWIPKHKTSVWQKFVDWIRNRLGFKKRKSDNVLDETNAFIYRILSGNRLNDTGPWLMAAETSGTTEKVLGEIIKAHSVASKAQAATGPQQFTDKVKDFFSQSIGGMAKRGVLFGMNTRMLEQVGSAYKLPQFKKLNELISDQEGDIQIELDQVKATAVNLAKWEKDNPTKVDAFDDLVHFSSIVGVDLRENESKYKKNKDKLTWYRENKKIYDDVIGQSGRAQYAEVIKLYEGILETMQNNILEPLNTYVKDKGRRNSLKKQLEEKLFNKAIIHPYIPLTREGNNWLQYDVEGETVYQTFSSNAERLRFKAQLEAGSEAINIYSFEGTESYDKDRLSSKSVIGQVVAELQRDAAVPDAVVDRMVQLYIEAMPESSYVKSLQTRKNDAGFQRSVLRGINIKAYEMVRQSVNIRYTRDIYQLRDSLDENLSVRVKQANILRDKDENDPERIKFEKKYGPVKDSTKENKDAFIETFEWRAQQATNPSSSYIERGAILANQFAFVGTMGFNVSSALLQIAGIGHILYPFLAAKTSWRSAAADISIATRFFGGSGLDRKVTTAGGVETTLKEAYIGAPSIDNYYKVLKTKKDGRAEYELVIRDDIKLNDDPKEVFYSRKDKNGKVIQNFTQKQFVEEMRPLVQLAAKRAILNKTVNQEMMGLDISGQKESNKMGQLWKDFNTIMAYPFQLGDRSQRQVTLVAAYLTEMERLTNNPNKSKREQVLTPEQIKELAMDTAISDMERTGGTNLLAQAPPIAQRNIGRVMMMFRTYGLTIYGHQIALIKEFIDAGKTGDKESRRIAAKQMIATQALTAAMSGVAGLTAYGMFVALYNTLFEDEEDERLDTLIRKQLGEGLYKGGVNYVFAQMGIPLDLSARIGLANMLISSDRYNFSRSPEESILNEIGGAAWSTGKRVARGLDKLFEGEIQRGTEDIMPVSVRNMLQAYRFANEGALTRRGDAITQEDFNGGTIAAKFFGFAPAAYTLAQEKAQDLKRIDKAVSAKRTKLLKRMHLAQRRGDIRALIDTKRDIAAFNKRHAKLGPKVPITEDTIKRSMRQHMKTSEKMINGVQLSPSMRDTMKIWAEGYDRGPAFL